MKKTIALLKRKVFNITNGLPVAEVVHVTNEDVIVSYEGKNVYALTNVQYRVGDLLLVDGTYQVPTKPEEIPMGILNEHSHNSVGILKGIAVDDVSLLRDYEQSISVLEEELMRLES